MRLGTHKLAQRHLLCGFRKITA